MSTTIAVVLELSCLGSTFAKDACAKLAELPRRVAVNKGNLMANND